MSQTPDQPGTPEPSRPQPAHPAQPGQPTQPQYAASARGAPTAARPSGDSMWGEATSTRGGTLAVVLAGAGLGLVLILLAGLAAVLLVREVGDDDDRAPWADQSREMPGGERMHPGRGPGQMPPGQQRRDGSELPDLGLPGLGGPLHGEAVLPGEGAATRTVVFQRGEVTAVTADKLTVRSTDGYSATYTIGADSRQRLQDKVSTLVTGDQVTVVASKDGNVTLRILKGLRGAKD